METGAHSIRVRTVRRRAAALIALAGLLNLISAVTPPLRTRLDEVNAFVPLAVSQTAAVLTGVSGIVLLLLSGAIRRGQRLAWQIVIVLLSGSALLHIAKGADFEEALVALLLVTYLIINRKYFHAPKTVESMRRPITLLFFGIAAATTVGAFVIEIYTSRGTRLSVTDSLENSFLRLFGIRSQPLPPHLDTFLTPVLIVVSVVLVAVVAYLFFQPTIVAHRRHHVTIEEARRIVGKYGGDSLDEFALRSDKHFFVYLETLVAYCIFNSVCLVSPDPIGPAEERSVAWAEFRRFVESHGWSLAVLGASESWLPTYRSSGMLDMYVGDEAIVDVHDFSLDGGKMKALRQAVNRVDNYGYTIEFFDPSALTPEFEAELLQLMRQSRKGTSERGFSMTLGRLFDDDDQHFLLSVVFDSAHIPVAFCQFVPAMKINGYSLDIMRRDLGDHPNGLIDFLIVRTINHLKNSGYDRLGLNFAVLRAVLATEQESNMFKRVEKWLLMQMSDSMQIASLWRFNAKFNPQWTPRYLVYDAPEHLLSFGVAIATAEGVFELPVLGRFIARSLKKAEQNPQLPTPV